MMTNSEIRALLADCEDEYHLLGRNTGLNVPKLRTALETLLAREAEVLALCDDFDMPVTDDIRAILDPQPDTMAKEKTNG